MKSGIATAERNKKPSLTMVVKTRTPIEAFQMLRQGHPIDVAAGYFDEQNTLPNDFWMMDKTAKLHALAELKESERILIANAKAVQDELITLKNQLDEQEKANAQNPEGGNSKGATQGVSEPKG